MPETQKDLDYFNVTVYGDYFMAASEGNSVKGFGPVTLKMRTWENCQKMTMFFIIPALLQKADMQFKSVRRCTIISIMTADDKEVYGLPLRYMSREQIAMECRSKHIPLRVEMYSDILQLRKKLMFARSNMDKFKQQEQRNLKAFEKLDDTLDLNAGIFEKIKKQNASPSDMTTEHLHYSAVGTVAHVADTAYSSGVAETIQERTQMVDPHLGDGNGSAEAMPHVVVTDPNTSDPNAEITEDFQL